MSLKHIIKMLMYIGKVMHGLTPSLVFNGQKKTLKPAVSDNESEFVLFCDNLTAQTSNAFLSEIRAMNGIVWFGETGATDIWQPVDNGFGKMLKAKISSLQEQWLEQDENIDLWTGNGDKKLDVKQRRILITHWVGEAFNTLMDEEYSKTR